MWKRTYSHRQQTKHKINYYLWLTKLVTPFKKKKIQWCQNRYSQNNTKRLIFRIYLKMKRKNTWKLPSWKVFWQHTAKNQVFLPLDPTTQLAGIYFMEIATCTRMCITTLFVELKNWRKPKWSKETCLMSIYEHSVTWGKDMLCESNKLWPLPMWSVHTKRPGADLFTPASETPSADTWI